MVEVSSEYTIPVHWLTVNFLVEPWAAQPLFTYTVIENEVPDYDQERVYDRGPGEAPGRLTPAPRHLENHQQGRTEDRRPQGTRDLETKIEGSIDYLKQHRSVIGDSLDPEDRVWLYEIDAMIAALGKRLAKPDSQTPNINDYIHDRDFRLRPFQSQSKPYPGPPIRSLEEERLYQEDDFQSRSFRPASIERRNMDRRPLSRRPSDRAKHVRERLNANLAERGLQIVPEDDLGLYEFIEESRKLGRALPSPQSSPQWPRESHRRRSADSGGADKRSFEPTRAKPGESDEITIEKINKKGKLDVIVEDPIQRDEKRVIFKDQQRPSHYTGYDENDYGRETDRREMVHQPRGNAKKLIKGGKGEGHEYGLPTETVDLTRPTYIMVHRKYLSPDTLDAYELPWEWKEVSPARYLVCCLADKIVPG